MSGRLWGGGAGTASVGSKGKKLGYGFKVRSKGLENGFEQSRPPTGAVTESSLIPTPFSTPKTTKPSLQMHPQPSLAPPTTYNRSPGTSLHNQEKWGVPSSGYS
ncbi:MAG: hypothetical protein ACLTBV_25235 [Enterocloster bolteae]